MPEICTRDKAYGQRLDVVGAGDVAELIHAALVVVHLAVGGNSARLGAGGKLADLGKALPDVLVTLVGVCMEAGLVQVYRQTRVSKVHCGTFAYLRLGPVAPGLGAPAFRVGGQAGPWREAGGQGGRA